MLEQDAKLFMVEKMNWKRFEPILKVAFSVVLFLRKYLCDFATSKVHYSSVDRLVLIDEYKWSFYDIGVFDEYRK